MPEAVIVSAVRSPIGRAFKGSLTSMRPDDLAAQMVRAALDAVPQVADTDVEDLILGCGLPGGEQGYNMGRVVATLLGMDSVPGTTITRYCSSSLQTTRMAMHAIRAGEGDIFVSAGVETVSRFAKGSSDGLPDTTNPVFADAETRTEKRAQGGAETWTDPRAAGELPDVYIAMGQTAENVAQLKGVTRAEQDEWGARSQQRGALLFGGVAVPGFAAVERYVPPVAALAAQVPLALLSKAAGCLPSVLLAWWQARTGATPGKRLLQVRVVDRYGLRPPKRALFLRGLFQTLPSWGLALGGLTEELTGQRWLEQSLDLFVLTLFALDLLPAPFRADRRAVHDLILGTRVVLDTGRRS